MKQLTKTLLVLFVFASLLSAQKIDESKVKHYEFFVKNLKKSLVSESPGIQQSAIKLAGTHKVKKVAGILEDLLEETKDEKTKIMIAQSLFEIGKESSMEKLAELAVAEKSQNVKKVYTALYKQYSEKE